MERVRDAQESIKRDFMNKLRRGWIDELLSKNRLKRLEMHSCDSSAIKENGKGKETEADWNDRLDSLRFTLCQAVESDIGEDVLKQTVKDLNNMVFYGDSREDRIFEPFPNKKEQNAIFELLKPGRLQTQSTLKALTT